jgi:hypothetical protein
VWFGSLQLPWWLSHEPDVGCDDPSGTWLPDPKAHTPAALDGRCCHHAGRFLSWIDFFPMPRRPRADLGLEEPKVATKAVARYGIGVALARPLVDEGGGHSQQLCNLSDRQKSRGDQPKLLPGSPARFLRVATDP